MMAKTHCLFGILCVAITAETGVIEGGAVAFGLGVFGALLPDIDCPTSTIGRRVLPVSTLLSCIWGHRTLTHSMAGIAVWLIALMALWGGAAMPYLAPLTIGYCSHLFLDWLTPSGLMLMWPQKRRFRCPVFLIQTGSFFEAAFALVLALTLAWMNLR